MKTLRKTTKADLLVSLFPNVGDERNLDAVYKLTGISNYNSLKAFCSYIRKAKHIPDENRVNIVIRKNKCVREG
jgi:hypothetical protein